MAKSKDKNGKIGDHEDRMAELAEGFDLGEGAEVTMGLGEKVLWHYNNRPLLGGEPPFGLKVAISSSAGEQERLLHLLLEKTRSQVELP